MFITSFKNCVPEPGTNAIDEKSSVASKCLFVLIILVFNLFSIKDFISICPVLLITPYRPAPLVSFVFANIPASLISKILSYAGSILIKRTWREAGKEITRNIRSEDFDNIIKALNDGWVITFPRGTTDNSKPVRSGTAYIIKQTNPIVIPVKIDGFVDVFERNSLKIKNKTKPFSIKFGNALKFHDNESIESITNQIEKIID